RELERFSPLKPIPTRLLRAVHRLIGMAEELRKVGGVFGVVGDADAGQDLPVMALEDHGHGEGLADFFRHLAGILGAVDPVEQYHEFITADARHGIGFAHALFQAMGHFLEQQIACSVTEGVVDLFEFVQIQIEQRQTSFAGLRPLQRLQQAFLQ
nr:hypothetical protein [Tanacetum cinerariifolium]